MIRRLGRRGLPAPTHAAWRAAVVAAGEPDEPVLAWATVSGGGETAVIGTRGRLWVPDGGGWTAVGWHRIDQGSWNAELRRLSWRLDDHTRGQVDLVEPGRVPDLFRERIAAAVAVEETVRVGAGQTITVSGRRDLSYPTRPLLWHTTLGRGVSWAHAGVAEQADATLERLRAEYGR
ncbi:hypothetical protein FHX74_003436 [Friedmanniella endophytica]|uniref:Uncharacterized protein n=1 Tax=Microlunatus kandeliicorticis TaxID=1759536 RepID=A0A7W3P7B1_9ACTN|nr:hypothetical protein [Microlunatus kandeliicorticis]MBA8795795.1 hypothetical protein [Microlunatus kandeliicorticis]